MASPDDPQRPRYLTSAKLNSLLARCRVRRRPFLGIRSPTETGDWRVCDMKRWDRRAFDEQRNKLHLTELEGLRLWRGLHDDDDKYAPPRNPPQSDAEILRELAAQDRLSWAMYSGSDAGRSRSRSRSRSRCSKKKKKKKKKGCI